MASNQPDHRNTTEARAGATPHVARVVLVVGTLLCIALFVGIYLYFM